MRDVTVGTETGCWFAIKEMLDGSVDFEFYRFEIMVDHGIALSMADMYLRFDALDKAASLPLQ